MIRTVDQLLEGLESLILAALDELCTLDSQGVAQTIALSELQRVVTILEQHCDLDPAARARSAKCAKCMSASQRCRCCVEQLDRFLISQESSRRTEALTERRVKITLECSLCTAQSTDAARR